MPKSQPKWEQVDKDNFDFILNKKHSKGDFEYIENPKKSFYPFLLRVHNFDDRSSYQIHSKLMNIIQKVFLKQEIRKGAKIIYELIEKNPQENVELVVFEKIFPDALIRNIKKEVENDISKANFGELRPH